MRFIIGMLYSLFLLAGLCSASVNLLTNSSFEICTNEKLPDFWGNGRMGMASPRWVLDADGWRQHWGVDESTSHTGKYSLRIDFQGDASDLALHARWIDPPKLNVQYTLSVWLKADRENMPVAFGFEGVKDFTISTEWKRYSVTTEAYDKTLTIVLIPKGRGLVWIDDFQFEEGSEATDWKPAAVDASLTGNALHRIVPDTKPFKHAPSTDKISHVELDSERRFLVNSELFIPFASAWEQLPSNEIIEDTARAGFNSIVIWLNNQTKLEDIHRVFDEANSFGLKVIAGMGGGISNENRLLFISRLRNHPALIAWNVCDEPMRDDPTPDKAYSQAKQLDKIHPAYVNYAPGFYFPEKLPTDIASIDLYNIGCGGSPLDQANHTDMMEKIAIPAGKPSWIWLQASGNAYWLSREPTGPEEEAMVYLCLIHGVRGIKFWVTKPLSSELWKTLKLLSREVRQLTPVLYSLESSPTASVNPSSIHMASKTYRGRKYIICVNSSADKIEAEILVNNARGNARVLFENRTIKTVDGVIRDTFEGYQRHVYEVR